MRKGEHFRKVPTGHVSSSWSRSSLLIISVALGHIPRSWSRPSLLVTSLALSHVPRSWSHPSLLVTSLALGHVSSPWSRSSLLVTSLALGRVPRSWSRPSLLVTSPAGQGPGLRQLLRQRPLRPARVRPARRLRQVTSPRTGARVERGDVSCWLDGWDAASSPIAGR